MFSLNPKLRLTGLWYKNPRRNQEPRLEGKKEATAARLQGGVVCVPFQFSCRVRAGYSWTLCYQMPADEPSGSLSQRNLCNRHRHSRNILLVITLYGLSATWISSIEKCVKVKIVSESIQKVRRKTLSQNGRGFCFPFCTKD